MMARPTRCRNCNQLPEVIELDNEPLCEPYEFLLRHKAADSCAPDFKLETFQHTEFECIKDWNEFNAQPTGSNDNE